MKFWRRSCPPHKLRPVLQRDVHLSIRVNRNTGDRRRADRGDAVRINLDVTRVCAIRVIRGSTRQQRIGDPLHPVAVVGHQIAIAVQPKITGASRKILGRCGGRVRVRFPDREKALSGDRQIRANPGLGHRTLGEKILNPGNRDTISNLSGGGSRVTSTTIRGGRLQRLVECVGELDTA